MSAVTTLGLVCIFLLIANLALVLVAFNHVRSQTGHVEKLQRVLLAQNMNEWERMERTAQRPDIAAARATEAWTSSMARVQDDIAHQLAEMTGGLDGSQREEPAAMPSDLS